MMSPILRLSIAPSMETIISIRATLVRLQQVSSMTQDQNLMISYSSGCVGQTKVSQSHTLYQVGRQLTKTSKGMFNR